jgi:hypothetical protein
MIQHNGYSLVRKFGARGRVVVVVLRYKLEGRVFETLWRNEIVSIYLILSTPLEPGGYWDSNKN